MDIDGSRVCWPGFRARGFGSAAAVFGLSFENTLSNCRPSLLCYSFNNLPLYSASEVGVLAESCGMKRKMHGCASTGKSASAYICKVKDRLSLSTQTSQGSESQHVTCQKL